MKLDQNELALRMLEAGIGVKRPPGLTTVEALDHAPKNLLGAYMRASAAALRYFIECAGPLTILPDVRSYPDPAIESIMRAVDGKSGNGEV